MQARHDDVGVEDVGVEDVGVEDGPVHDAEDDTLGSALLLAVGTCVVLPFEAMPGLCCFLRVTHSEHAGTGYRLCGARTSSVLRRLNVNV